MRRSLVTSSLSSLPESWSPRFETAMELMLSGLPKMSWAPDSGSSMVGPIPAKLPFSATPFTVRSTGWSSTNMRSRPPACSSSSLAALSLTYASPGARLSRETVTPDIVCMLPKPERWAGSMPTRLVRPSLRSSSGLSAGTFSESCGIRPSMRSSPARSALSCSNLSIGMKDWPNSSPSPVRAGMMTSSMFRRPLMAMSRME